MSTARAIHRPARIPAWLLPTVIQASILAVLLLSGFTFYQADRLGYFVPDATTEAPPPPPFHWRNATP
jgi:hypothetical protein